MATAAHSYLTDLPWDNVKEMKEKGFFVFVRDYVQIIVNRGWSLIDDSGIM